MPIDGVILGYHNGFAGATFRKRDGFSIGGRHLDSVFPLPVLPIFCRKKKGRKVFNRYCLGHAQPERRIYDLGLFFLVLSFCLVVLLLWRKREGDPRPKGETEGNASRKPWVGASRKISKKPALSEARSQKLYSSGRWQQKLRVGS